jgi:hypothetical protein
MMALFRKGSCQLSAFLDRDVFIPGEKLMVLCSVSNLSNMDIRTLSLRVYEYLKLHHTGREIEHQPTYAEEIFQASWQGSLRTER